MKKILVPIDGSENSKKALMRAKEYAKVFDAKLDILNVAQHVTMDTYMLPQYTKDTNKDFQENARKLLDDAKDSVEELKDQVSTKVRSGDSADEIIAQIKEEDYDLVVMGSRGLGAIRRTMLGSVSHKVLNSVETNILIVK